MSENKIDAGEARRLDYLRALEEELVGYERHGLDDRAGAVRAEIERVEAQAPDEEPVVDEDVDESADDQAADDQAADEQAPDEEPAVDEEPVEDKPAKVAREPKPRGRRSARRETADS